MRAGVRAGGRPGRATGQRAGRAVVGGRAGDGRARGGPGGASDKRCTAVLAVWGCGCVCMSVRVGVRACGWVGVDRWGRVGLWVWVGVGVGVGLAWRGRVSVCVCVCMSAGVCAGVCVCVCLCCVCVCGNVNHARTWMPGSHPRALPSQDKHQQLLPAQRRGTANDALLSPQNPVPVPRN